MGYNLAIEYLADYEKTWMLDSFRSLNESVLKPLRRPLKEWIFLEVFSSALLLCRPHAGALKSQKAISYNLVKALLLKG